MKRKILLAALGGIVLGLSLVSFLLLSDVGLRLIVRYIPDISGGMVEIAGSEGNLLGSWKLKNVKVDLPAAEISIGEMGCSLRPSKLFRKELHFGAVFADNVEIVLSESKTKQPETEAGKINLPVVSVPIAILIEQLDITQGIIRKSGSPEALFLLNSLSVKISGNLDLLKIEAINLTTPDYGGTLQGTLQLSGDWPVELQGGWWLEQDSYQRLDGTFLISGSVETPDLEIALVSPLNAAITGSVEDLLDNPSWDFKGGAKRLNPRNISDDLPDLQIAFDLETKGSLDRYQAKIKGLLSETEFGSFNTDLSLSGSKTGLLIEDGLISAEAGVIKIGGEVTWKDFLSWDASVLFENIDPSLYPKVPAGNISGTLVTNGRVTEGVLMYSAKLDDLHGALTKPFLIVTGDLELAGDIDSLEIVSSNLSVGEGNVRLAGTISWKDIFAWDSRLNLDAIDPSLFGSLPAGQIEGSVSSSGSVSGDDLVAMVDLTELSGELAGYELTGTGKVTLKDGNLEVDKIHIKNGRNVIRIDGHVEEMIDLSFFASGDEFERLVPGLQGALKAEGIIGGTRKNPVLKLSTESTALSYMDYGVAAITGKLDLDLIDSGNFQADFDFSQISGSGYDVESAGVHISGTVDDHLASIQINSDFGTLGAEFSGKIVELKRWEGMVSKIEYFNALYGKWEQQGTAGLEAAAEGVKLSSLCIGTDETSFCSEVTWITPDIWSAELSDITFMLTNLNDWEVLQEELTGELTGQISGSGEGTSLTTISGELIVPELSVDLGIDDVYNDFRWFNTRLTLNLEKGEVVAGVSSRFVDDSFIDATVQVSNFGNLSAPMGELPLGGRVQLEIKDLSPLKGLTKEYLIPSGRLVSDFAIIGTVGAPRLDGNLELLDGEIKLPELGITLKEFAGTIVSKKDTISLAITTVSGEGKLSGKGGITFGKNSWDGKFKITGERVELMNQSEIGLMANPDIVLSVSSGGGDLKGTIVIPEARIEPEEMQGSDSESKDLVFMDEVKETSDWPFLIDLAIELGDKVHIDGYGLTGDIKGGIKVFSGNKDGLAGSGELFLEDSVFSIYGRSLEISRGRVLFNGGPVDSPGLDVSARKSIKADGFGKSDIIVGVNVDGNIHDYNVELFSIPDMEESEIFAYLVLDKSTSSGEAEDTIISAAAKSVGLGGDDGLLGKVSSLLSVDELRLEGSGFSEDTSLIVGKQLTEDLSVSYDFNLFKNLGFFKIRYKFGRGFFAESKSSTESNGIDFLYSFEN